MRRARDEDGFVLVAAIILLTVIFGLGLGLLLFSDGQQTASGREQASEAAFNVANAALNAQIGQLARKWPKEEAEMPNRCESSAVKEGETNDCPSPADLKLDPNTGSTTCPGTEAWGSSLSNQWTTYVRRDVTEGSTESLNFNSTEEEKQPTYAASPETGALWVRAVGVVQCHTVAVVSLVTRLHVRLIMSEYAIVGNWFKTSNKGNKVIINRLGRDSEPAAISMRCEPPHSRSEGKCEEYTEGQVAPPIGEEHPTAPSATFTTSQLETLKSEAKAYKTFYSSAFPYHCPSSMAELQGTELTTNTRAPVYIEGCGALSIKANAEANSEANPGFLVLANGTLEVSGTVNYYGVIYAANLEKSEGAMVILHGNGHIIGSIVVDGKGGIEFGSSGKEEGNFEFDSLAAHDLTISAGAAATRNSFRILPAGQ